MFSAATSVVLTSKIYVLFHVRVHFCEDLLKVVTDCCQNSSVGWERTSVCAQRNVTEQSCLPLIPQFTQHLSTVRCHRLRDASFGPHLNDTGTLRLKVWKEYSKCLVLSLSCSLPFSWCVDSDILGSPEQNLLFESTSLSREVCTINNLLEGFLD